MSEEHTIRTLEETMARVDMREHFGRAGCVVTAGVDTQSNGLLVTVVAWGQEERGRVRNYAFLEGDTEQQDVWEELGRFQDHYGIDYMAVDAGYRSSAVKRFTSGRGDRFAVKGVVFGNDDPLLHSNGAKPAGEIVPANFDQGKHIVRAGLAREWSDPGSITIPSGAPFDAEYCAQVYGEAPVERERGGRRWIGWVKERPNTNALDGLVLALLALRLSPHNLAATREPAGELPQGSSVVVEVLAAGYRVNVYAPARGLIFSSKCQPDAEEAFRVALNWCVGSDSPRGSSKG